MWKIRKENNNNSGEGGPLGIVQENDIWPYDQMVYAQPRICPGDLQNSLEF